MSRKQEKLTDRDYYLLGTLVEETRDREQILDRYSDEVERLVRAGYLEWRMLEYPDRRHIKYLHVTGKGQAVSRAYGFTDSEP